MKSFTRIGLPILVVVAAVFGFTYVRMYSGPDPGTTDGPKDTQPRKTASEMPLNIPLATAAPVPANPVGTQRSLVYWNPEIEVGMPGHFEFWGQNPHAEPVNLRVFQVNCQCAGVEMAPIPQNEFKEYAVESALAGSPLCPAAGPLAAFAHAQLNGRLAWAILLDKDQEGSEKVDRTIPGANSAAGTQVAVIRLGWKAKGEAGPRPIEATLMASIGDTQPKQFKLQVQTLNVPAFDTFHREGPSGWAFGAELSMGELRENGQVKRVVYLMSTTRRQLIYTIASDRPDPCVTWTEPISVSAPASASENEVQSLTDFFSQPGKPVRQIKSLYRFEVTIKERTETEIDGKKQFRQLDLGLLDRRLTVSAVEGGSIQLPMKARVLGDVSFLAGAPDGRVELGNSFAADADRTKDVVLLAERTGLELALSAAETSPNFLKVKLDPLEQIEGRNQWRLRVTVPKGSLYGALPPNSEVILTTGGPSPRRLRIPVRGMTYDSGGRPRL